MSKTSWENSEYCYTRDRGAYIRLGGLKLMGAGDVNLKQMLLALAF